MAVIVGLTFKRIFFNKEDVPFVMELPPYRIPTLRNTSTHMWNKAVQYLRKMGGIILVASILIWALGYYPKNINYSVDYGSLKEDVINNLNLSEDQKTEQLLKLELDQLGEKQENTYIGKMGKAIEPAIKPLGFDWKIGVSIITGMAAKEIVVSTMGVLYHAHFSESNSETLISKLQTQVYLSGDKKGEHVFTPLVAFSLMIFVLLYFPCIAVIAAIKKEGSWKWAVFTMFYTTALAWIASFIVYQVGSLF